MAGLPDVESRAQATGWRGKAVTWRAGPPRRYDVALRPRGRTRVAHAGRACGADVWPGATRTGHADAREGCHMSVRSHQEGGNKATCQSGRRPMKIEVFLPPNKTKRSFVRLPDARQSRRRRPMKKRRDFIPPNRTNAINVIFFRNNG